MQETIKNLSTRSLCAFLSAAAIVKLDPKAQIISHAATPWGFYCDCELSSNLDPSFLVRMEEVISDYSRSKNELVTMEMVPANAAEMLKHQGQLCRADALRRSSDGTVTILKVDHYSDHCEHIPQQLPRFFALVGFQKLPAHNLYRIYGTAFEEAGELRKAKKDFKNLPPVSHQEWAQTLELAIPIEKETEGSWVWLPRGVAVLDAIHAWWKRNCQKRGASIIASSKIFNDTLSGTALRHGEILQDWKSKKISEWVYASQLSQSDGLMAPSGCRMSCSSELGTPAELLDSCISSLQNLLEIPKIFDFSFHRLVLRTGRLKNKASPSWKACAATLKQAIDHFQLPVDHEDGGELSGPSLEMRFLDIWGTEYCSSLVGFDYKLPYANGKEVLLVESVIVNVERLIALILEVKKGELPFLLAPEQAWILCVSPSAEDYARTVWQVLLDKSVRAAYSVCEQRALAAQVHRAMNLKVPFIIVIGDKERMTETVALRTYSTEETPKGAMRVMKLNELLEQLQQEEKA